MSVFNCSATKATNLTKKLYDANLLGTKDNIKDRQRIFKEIGSRSKILYLKMSGLEKINDIARALKAFKTELGSDSIAKQLFIIPGSEDFGAVAKGLLILLRAY
jgi:cobalamin biosynthesis Co2+ chelatase CbiK